MGYRPCGHMKERLITPLHMVIYEEIAYLMLLYFTKYNSFLSSISLSDLLKTPLSIKGKIVRQRELLRWC